MTDGPEVQVDAGSEQAIVVLENGPISVTVCVPRRTPIPAPVILEGLEEALSEAAHTGCVASGYKNDVLDDIPSSIGLEQETGGGGQDA